MNFAVIGSGGREHAICFKLKQSPKIKKLVCIPGNAGTQKIAININEDILNFKALYKIIKKENIDIVVVGPELPLVEGLVDYLNEKKVRVFGPDKFASQLEGSKAFMKNLCKKNKVIRILIFFLTLHIFVELLLANNRLLVAQHSNRLIDLMVYLFLKPHKPHDPLFQEFQNYLD